MPFTVSCHTSTDSAGHAGPEDTPYAFGCFMFDIFIPQQYPMVPPLMVLETTGGGRARMGPNVYADGKVILHLILTLPAPLTISLVLSFCMGVH